ncbi:hypothetical protein TNCV_831701 [Trichonephila clavipes]|nr:hypothetical protein TNCV_831701 [Trichonephila clavipes]
MNVCKCIVPLRHEDTLLRLVAGDGRWEVPDPNPGCSNSKMGWNPAKSYYHLYGAQNYNRSTSSPFHDECHGPRSEYVR